MHGSARRLLFALLVFCVTVWSFRAEAAGDEAVVIVGAPETSTANVVTAVRAALKQRGYLVLSPKGLTAALGGASADQLADGPGASGLRERLGVDLVVVVSVKPSKEGGYDVRVVAAGAGAPRSKSGAATDVDLDATSATLVRDVVSPRQEAAPTEDVVVLKDGTSISGRVLKKEDGKFVVIRTPDGGEQTIAWTNVERVVLAPRGESGANARRGGLGLEVGGTLEDAEAKRRAWKARGGGLVSYEVKALITGILMPEQNLPCTSPSGRFNPAGGVGRGGGGGGGAGGRVGFMYLAPPDPEGSNTWYAFKVSSGVDFSYFAFSQPTIWRSSSERDCLSGSAEYINTSLLSLNVPFPVGVHFGLGGFGSAERWRGLVLGLSYAPSITYTKPSEGDGTSTFNPAGFDISFDITSLEATLDSMAAAAHFRINVFILPPVTKDTPLFGTLGLGAVWY